eukprot:m.351630 g.351630  ORF g.351630 m.351630 type:complete len:185 (-) comp20702_c0_seq18:121-675(-)
MQDAFSAIEKCTKPTIAAIHGHCIGAGIDLASACDIRHASACAKFSIKEVDVGMAADLGTLQRMPKICGNDSLLRELVYTARVFKPAEAVTLGMVSKVAETNGPEGVREQALALSSVIAAKSPTAVAGSKCSLSFSREHSTADGLEHVLALNTALLQTSDIPAILQHAAKNDTPAFASLVPPTR